jgi:hypothetical protein
MGLAKSIVQKIALCCVLNVIYFSYCHEQNSKFQYSFQFQFYLVFIEEVDP